eukprot:Em0015g801a
MRDDGEYSPYDPMSSEAIEGAYAASCLQHQLKDYTISFADMTQTRLSTGGIRSIRRSLLNLPSSPDIFGYWQWEEVASKGRFALYSILASVDIERGYMTAPSGSVDLSKGPSGIPYTVEFSAMVQVRHGFKTQRHVQRVGLTHPLQYHLRQQQGNAYHATTPTTPCARNGVSLATPHTALSCTGAANIMTSSLASPFVCMPSQFTSTLPTCTNVSAKTGAAGITGDPLVDQYIAVVPTLKPGEDDSCPVCLNQLSEPSDLDHVVPLVQIPYARPISVCLLKKCNHMLHRSCLISVKRHAKDGFQCPLCKKTYGIKTGDMPNGTMTVDKKSYSLPGYESYGTFEITYDFKAGNHNGRKYHASGFPRRCYLPQCPQGSQVLKLLTVAWDRKLTFTISTSVSTGLSETVVWNEIHHKTSITNHGGHGYPDPNYLDNVTAELAAQGDKDSSSAEVDVPEERHQNPKFHLNIYYGSQTGIGKRCAEKLATHAQSVGIECTIRAVGDIDPEETLTRQKSSCSICVFIISTYTDGSPPESANWFCQWLSDTACDFRVPKTFLSGLHYTVFGLGDSLYGENYNKWGRACLSGSSSGIDEDFEAWKKAFAAEVFPVLEGRKSMEALEQQMMSCGTESCACKSKDGPPTDASPCCRGGDTEDPAEEVLYTANTRYLPMQMNSIRISYILMFKGVHFWRIQTYNYSQSCTRPPVMMRRVEVGGSGGEDIMDLEDMGKVIRKAKVPKDPSAEPKEMVTPQLRETLTKQGLS